MLRKLKLGGVIFLSTLLSLVGCQSEKLVNEDGSQQGQQFTLTASKGIMSRTHLGSDGKQTVWSEGDKIYVSSANGKVHGTLELTSEPGETTGTFSGFVFGDTELLTYSVYPVPTAGKTIDLSQVIGGDKLNAPMVGQIDNKSVDFTNTCGILRLNLQNAVNQNYTISAKVKNGDEAASLLNTATVNVDDNGVASLAYSASETNTISLNNTIGGFMYVPYFINQDVDVYVGGIKIATIEKEKTVDNKPISFIGAIKQDDVKTLTYSNTTNGLIEPVEVNIDNNHVTDQTLNLTISSTQPGAGTTNQEVHEFVNIPSITEAFTGEGYNEVEVKNVVIELPQIKTTSNATTSVVSFEEIPQGVTVEIKEEEVTDKKSLEELTVILPSGTTEAEAKEAVVINMPNTTVTVKSADGKILLINEMTASTAENTLVIGKDVEIGSLTILKGGVSIYGKVHNITREKNNQDEKTKIYFGSGAVIGNIIDLMRNTHFEIEFENPADKPKDEVYDGNPTEREIELKRAAKNGGSFILRGGGLRLTSPLIVEKDFTLTFEGGNFDGNIGQFVDTKEWKSQVVVMPGVKFTFNGGGYYNTGQLDDEITNIRMAGGSSKPSKVIINGGNLIGSYHAIMIDENCLNAEVEINGGALSCDWNKQYNGVAIMNKSNAKVKINGGDISGYVSAVEMWGGEFIMTGGNINCSYQGDKTFVAHNNVAGNHIIGSALAFYPTKGRTVAATISGGRLSGLSSVYEVTGNVNLSITGGQFENAIVSNNCRKFISGGKFKVNPNPEYIVSGKVAKQNGGYYEIVNGEGGGNINPEGTISFENPGLAAALNADYPSNVKLDNGKAVFTRAWAESIVELNFSDQRTIESLAGIENFPNLVRLFCDRVGLKTLDISRNQKLKQIEVVGNELTSLNFSSNPALEIIKCNHQTNGCLSSLNISGNQSLKVLECQNNTITSLDLTNNINLEEIDCGVNKLTTLNLNSNLKLKKLFLACNQLTSLDVSKQLELTQLHCTENHISTLDITKNTKLNWLNCGNQQPDGSLITLVLTQAQKELWDDNWSKIEYWNSRNVKLSVVKSGNTASGKDMQDGGVF